MRTSTAPHGRASENQHTTRADEPAIKKLSENDASAPAGDELAVPCPVHQPDAPVLTPEQARLRRLNQHLLELIHNTGALPTEQERREAHSRHVHGALDIARELLREANGAAHDSAAENAETGATAPRTTNRWGPQYRPERMMEEIRRGLGDGDMAIVAIRREDDRAGEPWEQMPLVSVRAEIYRRNDGGGLEPVRQLQGVWQSPSGAARLLRRLGVKLTNAHDQHISMAVRLLRCRDALQTAYPAKRDAVVSTVEHELDAVARQLQES
jgi:hypothetical protein